MTPAEACDELSAWTLSLGDPEFVHQHVVDAWAAQSATAETKPIKLTFALIGLYLHLERGFTGRAVQLTHIALARRKETWPVFQLPAARGALTPADMLARPAGPERLRAIDQWCAEVWTTYRPSHTEVAVLLVRRGIVPLTPSPST